MSCLSWYLYRGAFAPLFFAGSHFMQKGPHTQKYQHMQKHYAGALYESLI